MCFGNPGRIAEHRAEDAKREAARISAEGERRMAAMQAQAEAIKPKFTPPPATVNSTLASTGGVKSSVSKRKSTQGVNKGIAALRIPLNTGGSGSNSNVNIG
jgi:regulator of protease activity HflC (stomatin/prohibitin superfamily)